MQQNKVLITRKKSENDTRKVRKKLRRTNRTRPLDDLRNEKKEAVEKVNSVVFHASNKIKQHRCRQEQRQDCGWEDSGLVSRNRTELNSQRTTIKDVDILDKALTKPSAPS